MNIEGNIVAVGLGAVSAMLVMAIRRLQAVGSALDAEATAKRDANERRYAFLETISDGVYIIDSDERLTHINEEAERLLRDAGQFVGRKLDEILDPLASDLLPEIRRARATGKWVARTTYFGATERWIEIRITLASTETLIYLRDVTVRKSAEEKLLESEGRLRLLMEQVPAVLWSVDRLGRFATLSGAGVSALKLDEVDLIGRSSSALLGSDDASQLEGVYAGESVQFDSPRAERWLRHHIEPLRAPNGNVIGAVGVSLDISEIKDAEKQLEAAARRDPLTGLPNRRALQEILESALGTSRQGPHEVAVIFVDLDRFKLINDTLGHHGGDEVLRIAAERLRSCVGPHDVVARHGGDEFIVVLTSTASLADSRDVANQIKKRFAEPVIVRGRHLYLTASLGIAVSPLHGVSPDTLIKNADAAMYAAKSAGRDAVVVFEKPGNETFDKLALEGDLRRGIGRGELHLVYQPIVNVQTGDVTGCEALARWNHPTRGELGPEVFIPIAEESGAIIELTRLVLARACAFSTAVRRTRRDFRVTVNLSPRDLRTPDIVATIAQEMRHAQLDPAGLELEVTENALLDDAAIHALHAIRALGVRIAVDDFGIAYNSLLYVKRLPITSLKIDRAFVQNLASDRHDQAIVRAITALGMSLGLHIIAEGIETEDQLRFVQTLYCEEAQGYYFSRPIGAQAFTELLERPVPHVSVTPSATYYGAHI